MKKEEQYIKKAISVLDHDRKLGLAVMMKTKQIISSKQGLISKQLKISALKKFSDKNRKASTKEYSTIINKTEKCLKKIDSARLTKKFNQLKEFYK